MRTTFILRTNVGTSMPTKIPIFLYKSVLFCLGLISMMWFSISLGVLTVGCKDGMFSVLDPVQGSYCLEWTMFRTKAPLSRVLFGQNLRISLLIDLPSFSLW